MTDKGNTMKRDSYVGVEPGDRVEFESSGGDIYGGVVWQSPTTGDILAGDTVLRLNGEWLPARTPARVTVTRRAEGADRGCVGCDKGKHMSDYPEALLRKVATALAESNNDYDAHDGWIWVPYMDDARAALDALGLREETGQHFRRVSDGWDEIVNQRRYVTEWEDA